MAEKPTCNLWLAQFALGQFGFMPHGQLRAFKIEKALTWVIVPSALGYHLGEE